MNETTPGVAHYEKRFGVIAVELGFIDIDQLVEALRTQVTEEIRERRHRPIGQILLEHGSMTASQIEEVVRSVVGSAR